MHWRGGLLAGEVSTDLLEGYDLAAQVVDGGGAAGTPTLLPGRSGGQGNRPQGTKKGPQDRSWGPFRACWWVTRAYVGRSRPCPLGPSLS